MVAGLMSLTILVVRIRVLLGRTWHPFGTRINILTSKSAWSKPCSVGPKARALALVVGND